MPTNIPTPTTASEKYTITANGFQLVLEFNFITRTNSWTLSVKDIEGNLLIAGVRLVPWTFLFRQHANQIGDLVLANKEASLFSSDEEPTVENFSTKYELVYFTAKEMEGVFVS